MQTRRFSNIIFLFAAVLGLGNTVVAESLQEAKMRVKEGFKAPSYMTNFPSEQLLSVADIKQKTYQIKQSKALRITRSATYDPKNELTGSPMFKVLASTVIIDLNGQVITKYVAGTEVRAVGIEVGYSPNELTNNWGGSLDVQPQNVIIRNGTIDNFDIGIVVHKGVKSVRFEDVTLSRTPVGIALLGGAGVDEEVVSTSFHNVKVIGAKLSDVTAATWAANKVDDDTWAAATHAETETQNYGYNFGSAQPTERLLQETDPVTGALATAAYYGIVMRHVNNVLVENVTVDGLGYRIATGDANAITAGIDITNSNNVFLDNVSSSHNVSYHMADGLHIKDSTSVSVVNSIFNNNSAARGNSGDATTARIAHGIHLEGVNASSLQNISANKNEADSTGDTNANYARAYGVLWETGNALDVRHVECSHNEGNAGYCYGMKLDTIESASLNDLIFDYNHGTGGDDGVTDYGATGLYLSTSAKSVNMSNVSVNANNGSSVAGLRVANGESITLKNFSSDYSNGTSNVIGLSFETGIKSLACENVSVVSNTSTGAAGSFVKAVSCAASQSVSFDGVRCNYNTSSGGNLPVTAIEFLTSAKTVTLKNVTASNNSANGTGAIAGLSIAESESVVLDGVQFNSNTGGAASNIIDFTGSASTVNMNFVHVNSNSVTAGAFNGILMDDAINVDMKHVSVNNNVTVGAAMRGLHMKHTGNSVVNSVDMRDVTVDGNSSDTADVRGLTIDDPRNISMFNCSMSDNKQTGVGASSTNVHGVQFSNSVESVSMEKVAVNNNISTGEGNVAGVVFGNAGTDNIVGIDMVGVRVNNTSAAYDDASTIGAAHGIHFKGIAKSCSFRDLSINYTNSTNADGAGTAGAANGIQFAAAAENINIAKASISHTTSSGNTDANAHGILFSGSIKSLEILDSIFNSTEGLNVHGIKAAAALENGTFVNVSADQNNGGGNVFGMDFAGGVNALNMKNVTATNNSSSGGTVHGMRFDDAVAISIDGASLDNNSSSFGVATGMEFKLTSNTSTDSVELRNMSIDNTVASAVSAGAIGLLIAAGENFILQNVTANHTKSTNATAGDVQGISFATSAESVEMQNVTMNGNTGAATHGLLVVDGKNFSMDNVSADQNSGSSTVFGMDFTTTGTVNAIDMHNISCNANVSAAGVAGGLRMDTVVAVNIEDLSADYNQAVGGEVVGLEFVTSASALNLRNVSASNNVSDADGTGIRVAAGNAISMDGVSANYNNAADGSIARGVHCVTSISSARMNNMSADSNYGGDQGVGIHLEGPSSVSMNGVSASKNDGDSRAYGVYLAGSGSNVLIRGGLLNGNVATDANTAMAAIDTTATVSKHLPVNHYDSVTGFATLEGGFGLYVDSVDSCQFEAVEASRNQGMRAGGIYVNNCNDSTLRGCKTSFQTATGDFFFDADPFAGLTNTAIDISAAQAATFFGDTTDTLNVELVQTTTDFLAALRNIKYLQDVDDYDPADSVVYTHLKNLAGTQLLLRAVMAQFRRFSTAVGVQLHNSVNGVVEDHIAVGNKSDKDSAMGIGITGTAEGHLIIRAKCSGNEAWADSKVAANGDIDISEVLPFWTFLDAQTLTADAPVLPDDTKIDPIVGTITSAMIAFAPELANQPDPLVIVQADRLAMAFITSAAEATWDSTFEEFGPAVGGEACGICIGDAAESIEISNCDCANNKGNAGKAFGLMQDVTTSLLAKDNRLYQTSANDLGYCFGLAEFTLQSNSIHVGNVMFSNSIGDHLNSNFFVPFDPDSHPNIFFPVKIGYNGDIGNFANASPFDNLVVNFVAAKQSDLYLGAGIAGTNNLWEDSGWVVAP